MEARIHRRSFIFGASCSLYGSVILPSCSTVPLTNRTQLNAFDSNAPIIILGGGTLGLPEVYGNEESLNKSAERQYEGFLSDAKEENILLDNTDESKKIEEIGKEIYTSLDTYYLNKREKNPVSAFNWKFALVESETVNAWCMPGGKIAFYTGILPICKNDDGIAAVMGHEIAHAFARHTVEKLTQYSMMQMAVIGLSNTKTGTKLLNKTYENNIMGQRSSVFGDLIKYGIFLPYSRKMESEADYLGMGFMNLAGFNTKECSKVWERMGNKKTLNNIIPEFMGSHPSPDNRSKKFLEWESEILDKFPQV